MDFVLRSVIHEYHETLLAIMHQCIDVKLNNPYQNMFCSSTKHLKSISYYLMPLQAFLYQKTLLITNKFEFGQIFKHLKKPAHVHSINALPSLVFTIPFLLMSKAQWQK